MAPASALDSLCYNISSLQQLARQGSWRDLLETISQARKLSLPSSPHEQLVYHAFFVLSFMKLRNYGAAADEIYSLADLDSPLYQYEHYPALYPSRSGSMVPFMLRLLHAELPHRLGQSSLTIERLYALFDRCRQRIDLLQGGRDPADLASDSSSEQRFRPPEIVGDARLLSKVDDSDEPLDLNRGSSNIGNQYSNAALNSPLQCDRLNLTSVAPEPAQPHEFGVSPIDLKNANGNTVEAATEKLQEIKLDENGTADGTTSSRADVGVALDNSPDSDPDFGEFVTGVSAVVEEPQKCSERDAYDTSVSVTNVLRRWKHRQEIVMNSIVSHHLIQRDFEVVLKWFKQLLRNHPTDLLLLSKFGYVQLQFGDLSGAKDTFSKVESLINPVTVGNSLQSSYLKSLVHRNRGIQQVVLKQYSEAIREFDAALELNPVDIASANNKALCYMYSRDLIGSTKVLETFLDKVPLVALNESLVLNLCSMYELALVNNAQTKKTLSDWIIRVAPDDFDLTCTRL